MPRRRATFAPIQPVTNGECVWTIAKSATRGRSTVRTYGTHSRYAVSVGNGSEGNRTMSPPSSAKCGNCGAIVVTATPAASSPDRSASMLATIPLTIGR
jgi:hypothetical protein